MEFSHLEGSGKRVVASRLFLEDSAGLLGSRQSLESGGEFGEEGILALFQNHSYNIPLQTA
jgi:hypothetical protein